MSSRIRALRVALVGALPLLLVVVVEGRRWVGMA